ncbi:hypothetical protein ACROYT_G003045 [Oculina patagonica]
MLRENKRGTVSLISPFLSQKIKGRFTCDPKVARPLLAGQPLKQLKKNLEKDLENAKTEVAALEKQAKQKAKEQARVDQLRTGLAAKERERNTMQKRLNETRTFDELNEQEAELKGQNEEDQKIIEDENTSPTDKQAAEERVAERNEELRRLQTQIAERERALPLRERIKEIFKKYGVTVTAILLQVSRLVLLSVQLLTL